jgi:hypothetical protein
LGLILTDYSMVLEESMTSAVLQLKLEVAVQAEQGCGL